MISFMPFVAEAVEPFQGSAPAMATPGLHPGLGR